MSNVGKVNEKSNDSQGAMAGAHHFIPRNSKPCLAFSTSSSSSRPSWVVHPSSRGISAVDFPGTAN